MVQKENKLIFRGIYTFFMSLAVVTYCVYIMTGGDTSQLWLPFFETDLKDTLQGKA